MEIFKRSWRLKIQIGNTIKTYQELGYTDQSLKIDFSITIGVNGIFSNGDITISGLTDKDMELISSGYMPYMGVFKNNAISLEVGYINSLGLIIKGNIIDIDPNFNELGNSITLRVMSGAGNNLSNNNVSTSLANKVKFEKVCSECAKNNGMTLKYDKTLSDRSLTDYSFNGTPFQQIENLRKYFNDLDIFVDGSKSVLTVLKKEGGQVIRTDVLSNKTGLIGKPRPTTQGMQITSLMNTNFMAGGFVKLKNEKLTSFDGTYRIWELKHIGSNFGGTWITQIIAQRVKK